MRIGFLLFDDFDLLDFVGPYDVFLTASRMVERDGGEPPFSVVTFGLEGKSVKAYGGVRITPDADAAHVHDLAVLVVPGAIAIKEVAARKPLVDLVGGLAQEAELVTSVCTGAFLLGAAGVLEGRAWTTHHEDVDALAESLGSAGRQRARWVDSGRVVTAGGLSSGIAMALHVVERFCGRELAVRTAEQIEYAWDPDDGVSTRGRPSI